MFLLFLEIGIIMFVVILAYQCLLLCPHNKVVDCCIEQEVHNRLVVGQHLSHLCQPIIISSGIHVGHILDRAENHCGTVFLYHAFQHIVVIRCFGYIGTVGRYGLSRHAVMECHRAIAADLFDFIFVGIISDTEFSVLPV